MITKTRVTVVRDTQGNDCSDTWDSKHFESLAEASEYYGEEYVLRVFNAAEEARAREDARRQLVFHLRSIQTLLNK